MDERVGDLRSHLGSLERFALGAIVSPAALGRYAAPLDAASRLLLVPSAISAALFPACGARRRGENEFLDAPMALVVAVLVPLGAGLVVSAETLVVWWLGGDFAGAPPRALQILIVSTVLNAFAFVPYAVIQGAGNPAWKARLDMVELVLFAGLCFPLVHAMGIVGAALSKLAITIIDVCALLCFARLPWTMIAWFAFWSRRRPCVPHVSSRSPLCPR